MSVLYESAHPHKLTPVFIRKRSSYGPPDSERKMTSRDFSNKVSKGDNPSPLWG